MFRSAFDCSGVNLSACWRKPYLHINAWYIYLRFSSKWNQTFDRTSQLFKEHKPNCDFISISYGNRNFSLVIRCFLELWTKFWVYLKFFWKMSTRQHFQLWCVKCWSPLFSEQIGEILNSFPWSDWEGWKFGKNNKFFSLFTFQLFKFTKWMLFV